MPSRLKASLGASEKAGPDSLSEKAGLGVRCTDMKAAKIIPYGKRSGTLADL